MLKNCSQEKLNLLKSKMLIQETSLKATQQINRYDGRRKEGRKKEDGCN